jgi:hypothetical protein
MKLISHRGNLYGPDPEKENNPEYIKIAYDLGYDVEIDLWSNNTEMFLGHDKPQYKVDYDFINSMSDKLWIHCKNLEALYCCKFLLKDTHYFWHQSDDFTLTSKNIIWTYPGKELTPNSVIVMPELNNFSDVGPDVYGICTDEVIEVKEMLDDIPVS